MSLSADRSRESWEGLQMFAERQVPADDLRLDTVRSRFRANIGEILGIARGAGAEAILCTVAVNLRDCAPFSGQDANILYSNACAMAAAGDLEQARNTFELACDRDTLRVRADTAINESLRDIGASGQPGVHFVDIERRFRDLSASGIPGEDYFVDHVHFNFAGNYALASNVAEAVDGLPRLQDTPPQRTPSLSECRDRLLYTVWDELELANMSIQRMRCPPFKDQPGNRAHIEALVRQKMDLQDSAQSVSLDEMRQRFLDAMRLHPGDWFYPNGWGMILNNRHMFQEAEGHLRQALTLAPHRFDFRSALAMVLGCLGRASDGVQVILGQDRKGGQFLSQWLMRAGHVLSAKGRLNDAVEFLQEAMRLAPGDADAQRELASCFIRLGRLKEGEAMLRDVLRKHPDNAEAIENLATLLAVNQRRDEAMTLFRQAMDRKPVRPETHLKYALCFMYRGDVEQAIRELEQLVGDSPDFVQARFKLGQLYSKQRLWDSAAAQFEKAVELLPDYADAWFQLAQVREAQGRGADARESLMNAVRLAPERKDILNEWNRLYPDP